MLNERAQKLVNSLPENFEAAWIGTEVSRFYLLDFDAGDAGTLLLFPDEMVYIIDARYIESAEREISCARVILEKDAMGQAAEIYREKSVHTVHVEDGVTLREIARAEKAWPQKLETGDTLGAALRRQRVVKDAEEIRRMREAQRITDACFAHILPLIKEGEREVDLALEMERFMRASGADKAAFDTIFVSGQKTSLPHGAPGEKRLQKGDFITMDFGAKYKGYCADMTRTVALGEPAPEQKEVYELVLRAHLEAMKAAKGGMAGRDVDKVARDIITGAGYGSNFGHGLGHSLGIEIHEDPRFSPKEGGVVPVGSMMTVEPGVYLAGKFGVRIEDMVLMGEDGCEALPTSDKSLIVL